MNEKEILEGVTAVVRKIVRAEGIVLRPETTAKDIEGWDSLSHIQIIAAIEDLFRIRFQFEDILNLNNVGDIVLKIREKLADVKS